MLNKQLLEEEEDILTPDELHRPKRKMRQKCNKNILLNFI